MSRRPLPRRPAEPAEFSSRHRPAGPEFVRRSRKRGNGRTWSMASLRMDTTYLLSFDPVPWRWEVIALAQHAGRPFDPRDRDPEDDEHGHD